MDWPCSWPSVAVCGSVSGKPLLSTEPHSAFKQYKKKVWSQAQGNIVCINFNECKKKNVFCSDEMIQRSTQPNYRARIFLCVLVSHPNLFTLITRLPLTFLCHLFVMSQEIKLFQSTYCTFVVCGAIQTELCEIIIPCSCGHFKFFWMLLSIAQAIEIWKVI